MNFIDTKKGRVKWFDEHIIHHLSDSFDIRIIDVNHYRIMSRFNDKMVDYFPKSERVFFLEDKRWDSIKILELEDKLKKYLNE